MWVCRSGVGRSIYVFQCSLLKVMVRNVRGSYVGEENTTCSIVIVKKRERERKRCLYFKCGMSGVVYRC